MSAPSSQGKFDYMAVSSAIFLNTVGVLNTYKTSGVNIHLCNLDMCGTDKSIVYAALLGRVEAIRVFCELGADANTRDKDGHTPVSAAAEKGHVVAIRALCELGADINTRSKIGNTPVRAAAQNDQVDAIRICCELMSTLPLMAALLCM
jgi:hypothetical protein